MLPSSIALANFVRFRMPAPAPDLERRAPSPVLAQPSVDWEARGEVRRELVRSVRALDELERILGTGRRGAVEPARAQSQLDIGLDPSPATAATLGSLTEVNAIPHSFSSYAPPWSGSSSAALVLDGDYNGDNGTTTLTFESKRNGTHGSKDLRIDVLDPGGNRIDRIDIKKSDPLDKVYSLSNGMTFTLGAGSLVKKDTLTVDVSATTGTAVDPDKPLDGVGDDDARLESALVVGPGNFTINGSTIDVFSGDSLNDVLGRINASGAGVTASFDAPSERVVLTQSTTGSAPSIVLGVDSSGFLAATKLDGAAVIPGTDYEPDVALSSLSQFSAVSSGTVSVNGVDVAIDVNADSLLDVLSRINTSGAGVLATLSPSAQRVTIESTDRDRSLTLEQNTTMGRSNQRGRKANRRSGS